MWPYENSRLSVWCAKWLGWGCNLNPAVSGLVTALSDAAIWKNRLSQLGLKTSGKIYYLFFFFRNIILSSDNRNCFGSLGFSSLRLWGEEAWLFGREWGLHVYLHYCRLYRIIFVWCSNSVSEHVSVVSSRNPLSFSFLSIPPSIQ